MPFGLSRTGAHDHWGETWSGSGVGLTLNSSNGDGLHVSGGDDGIYVNGAGDDGIWVLQPGDDGLHVSSPGLNGVAVYSPVNHGVWVNSPGSDGVAIVSPGDDGVYGVYASTTATYGFYTPDKMYAGNGYVDIAEHINAANDVEPGDVVVIDPDHDERVKRCHSSSGSPVGFPTEHLCGSGDGFQRPMA